MTYQVYLIGDEDDPELCKMWELLNKHNTSPVIYKSERAIRWFENLNFCGCGCPEEAADYLANLLAVLSKRGAERGRRARRWMPP